MYRNQHRIRVRIKLEMSSTMNHIDKYLLDLNCLEMVFLILEVLISSHLSPFTLEVVGALQMTLQRYLSILPCLPLPSGNLQTPFPSIPWCYLPISSSVFLSFLLLSLSLAELSSYLNIESGKKGPFYKIWRKLDKFQRRQISYITMN